ncbi:cytidylyltransferase-like domain-containing protein [Ditylenchus destructor]|uniref:Cytidylyltransferase-like domain-containing protein n=1 Tax=Ditylenchus destructor TaxID=166010 RepID=A0AAD4NCV5_9BILA|nr:cytidylyltransferase-like domain-containing protein [Ditylenchus destructor]
MNIFQPAENIVLLANGSFDPPTFAHLRIFEEARSLLEHIFGPHKFEGILHPLIDTESKRVDISPIFHRLRMCQLAVQDSGWIRVNSWQPKKSTRHTNSSNCYPLGDGAQQNSNNNNITATNNDEEHTQSLPLAAQSSTSLPVGCGFEVARLVALLRHFHHFYVNRDGKRARIFLICGPQLAEQIVACPISIQKPGKFPIEEFEDKKSADFQVKTEEYGISQLVELVKNFGVIIPRLSSLSQSPHIRPTIHPELVKYVHNIHVIETGGLGDVYSYSSSTVRESVRKGESIRYRVPDQVIDYIETYQLYRKGSIISENMRWENVRSRFRRESKNSKNCRITRSARNLANWTVTANCQPHECICPGDKWCYFPSNGVVNMDGNSLCNDSGWNRADSSAGSVMSKSLTFEPSTSSRAPTDIDDNEDDVVWRSRPAQPNFCSHSKFNISDPLRQSSRPTSLSQTMLAPCDASDYDNLTLDEILEVSRKWGNYFAQLAEEPTYLPRQRVERHSISANNYASSINKTGQSKDPPSYQQSLHRNGHLPPRQRFTSNTNTNNDLTQQQQKSLRFTSSTKGSSSITEEITRDNSEDSNNMAPSLANVAELTDERQQLNASSSVVLTFRRYRLRAQPETTV